jgi:hypothetical protein
LTNLPADEDRRNDPGLIDNKVIVEDRKQQLATTNQGNPHDPHALEQRQRAGRHD